MDEHAIKAHLEDLRRQFPSLPVLRDFQVIFSNFQSQWQSILRWTFWSLHWMHMTRTISWSPFLPGMGRLFPCCCSGICCLPVQTPWHAKILPFSRIHHNCCDPDNNYWTAAGGRLPKTGHYSIVGCPGHVRYFSGLTWNFSLAQFVYVILASINHFPLPLT